MEREQEHDEEDVEKVVDDEREHELVEDGVDLLFEQSEDGEHIDDQPGQTEQKEAVAVDVPLEAGTAPWHHGVLFFLLHRRTTN